MQNLKLLGVIAATIIFSLFTNVGMACKAHHGKPCHCAHKCKCENGKCDCKHKHMKKHSPEGY